MSRATLHYGGRSPVDGAWDAEGNLNCIELKTLSRRKAKRIIVGGCYIPGYGCASCLTSVLLWCRWLLSHNRTVP